MLCSTFRRVNSARTSSYLIKLSFHSIDLSSPHLWYPSARKLTRKIICHVGPTNSGFITYNNLPGELLRLQSILPGKTYAALEKLKASHKGLYCGPLRLLAWEICDKLRANNVQCNLITGNEQDYCEGGGTHTSCTVEMADLKSTFDVAVVDEAQLIGDRSRGQ